jgi:hypothetical protein
LQHGGSYVPNNMHDFRKRYPEKEIQPDMHFTSTGVDRIAANLERMINNSVEVRLLNISQYQAYRVTASESVGFIFTRNQVKTFY